MWQEPLWITLEGGCRWKGAVLNGNEKNRDWSPWRGNCGATGFWDHRGYFMETYNQKAFPNLGFDAVFVQDNQSFTAEKGTLWGIHFQNVPYSQAKLVRVTKGEVLDVAVDLRKGSPSYKRWVAVELSAENKRMLFVLRGFGHDFCTLTDNVEFCYKADNLYNKECDRGIRYNDPTIGVEWGEVKDELLSVKDTTSSLQDDSDCNFIYGEI